MECTKEHTKAIKGNKGCMCKTNVVKIGVMSIKIKFSLNFSNK